MAKKDGMPRLGRGLAALLGEQAPQLAQATRAGGPSHTSTTLSVDVLAPSPFQPRRDMNPARLEELAVSIRSRGVLQPLLVRPNPDQKGHYQIIAGERRWRAAQQAGLHDVPVHIRELDDMDAMAAALVENLQRADLNPIEEAEGLQRLLTDYVLTQEELAGAVGKSRPHIANMLRLLKLPQLVRTHVREGRLSAGHARALLGHPQPEDVAQVVLDRQLNVRQTEALVAAKSAPSDISEPKERDVEIVKLEESLANRLGLKVDIAYDGKKGGSLKISYRSLEQFEALMRLLNA
ncbi:chromosome partitioning protein ParB [Neokomagataea thailandica NBRC 106555]|uniref:ParB/RepB/Spo0J family partition protein n=2 Tax=Neokomagataea TaxID=1223423 RepID=A0A4Y6V842_9PROT|nr:MULTISPECIES: ParB/RepB/Spo0J family partition protein [Neokomagataea]QDH24726.1 ParB/RepB/Spo0J family partition protein [Neokomagataea tanensis]GBR53735.1 chromosome partitioning protein ParB [Neokomagataea thailandica NBRC 106555]